MQKEKINEVVRGAVINGLTNNSELNNRDYNVFEPVRNKKRDYIIWIMDQRTGQAVKVILLFKDIYLMDRDMVARIILLTIKNMVLITKKSGDKKVEINLAVKPLIFKNTKSILDKVYRINDKCHINFYKWGLNLQGV